MLTRADVTVVSVTDSSDANRTGELYGGTR